MVKSPRVIVVLVLVWWAAFFLTPALSGHFLPARDVASTQLPWRTVWRDQVRAGTTPIWDPLSNGGRPMLANPNAMALYPGTLLFLLTSPERAVAWHVALHQLLLLAGCYFLARRSGSEPAASWIGAIVAATAGVSFSALTFVNLQTSLAWLPWALAMVLPAPHDKRQACKQAFAAGAFLALSVLGGEPFAAGLGGLALIVVALMVWERRHWAILPITWLVAIGITAPLIVPLLTTYSDTLRGTFDPSHQAFVADALAPRRFVELFLPNLLGPPLAGPDTGFWAAPSFPWQRYYPLIFLGGLFFPLLRFISPKDRSQRPWLVLFGAGLLLAMLLSWTSTAAIAQAVPLVNSLRYSVKLLVLTFLSMSPLAASGWTRLSARWRQGGHRFCGRAALATLVGLPIMLFPSVALRPMLRACYPASEAKLGQVSDDSLRSWALQDWLALALPTTALALAGPHLAIISACVLVTNTWSARGLLLYDDVTRWEIPPPVHTDLGANTTIASFTNTSPKTKGTKYNQLDRYWRSRAALAPVYGVRWGHGYVLMRGPDGLEPFRQEILAAVAEKLSPKDRAHLAAACGAQVVISENPIDGLPSQQCDGVWIAQITATTPTFYLARRLLPANGPIATANTLEAVSFVPGRDAVVEGSGGMTELQGGVVTEQGGTPHHRSFQVTSADRAYLVVRQSYMQIWRALVDDVAAPVEPANGAMLGVHIGPGKHRVELFIDLRPYRWSLTGPLLIGLVFVVLCFRQRTTNAKLSP